MPGMGGIDLAREIRRLYPALPVLLASGYSEDIMRGAASEFEFVQKPYGADTLSIAIASQLRGPPKRGQSASAQAAC
jgi:CheY-like chemotaxis protein